MERHKWIVWAKPHPAQNAPDWFVLGTYRWRRLACLRAWWYEVSGIDHIARVEENT